MAILFSLGYHIYVIPFLSSSSAVLHPILTEVGESLSIVKLRPVPWGMEDEEKVALPEEDEAAESREKESI